MNKDLENSLGSNANTGAGLPEAKAEVVNTNVNASVIDDSLTPTAPVMSSPELPSDYKSMFGGQAVNKKQLENAADAIVKICGNTSILINQMVDYIVYTRQCIPTKTNDFVLHHRFRHCF